MNARTETILFSLTAVLFAGVMLSGLADLAYFSAYPAAEPQAVQSLGGNAGAAIPDGSAQRDSPNRRG